MHAFWTELPEVSTAEKPLYGYLLGQELNRRSGGGDDIQYGTLFPLLGELEQNDFIQGHWQPSRDGPPQKWFTVTGKGQQFLHAEKQGWIPVSKILFGTGRSDA